MGPDDFGFQPETNDDELGFTPDFKGESEHPLAGIEDWMDSKKASFIKNHPIISDLISKGWQGANTPLATFTPEMHKAVESYSQEHPIIGGIGKTGMSFIEGASTPLAVGLGAAGASVPALEAAGYTGIPKAIRNTSRIAAGGFGALGAKEAYEGYNEGDYSKILGGSLQLGLGGLGAMHHGPSISIEETPKPNPSFLEGADTFRHDEIPPMHPDASFVPVGEETLHNQSLEQGRVRPTHEDLALSNHPILPDEMGTPQNPELHTQIMGDIRRGDPTDIKTLSEAKTEELPEGWHRPDDNSHEIAQNNASEIANSPNKSGSMKITDLVKMQDQPGRIGNIATNERENLDNLKSDIQNNGIQQPIILKQNNEGQFNIEDGHHRLQAARELGLDEVPVTIGEKGSRSPNQTEKTIRLYRGESESGIAGDKAGQNFTSDPLAAQFYAKQNGGSGKTYYIDLSESEAARYLDKNATENGGHILPPDLANEARKNVLGEGLAEGTSVIKPKLVDKPIPRMKDFIANLPQTGNLELDNAIAKVKAYRAKGALTEPEFEDFSKEYQFVRQHPDIPPELKTEWDKVAENEKNTGPKLNLRAGDKVRIKEPETKIEPNRNFGVIQGGRVEPLSEATINKPVQDGFAEPKFAEDNTLKEVGNKEVPPPGQYTAFNDVSPINAEGSSVHKLLSSRPETKPIADELINATDKGGEWLASSMRDFAEISQGLDKNQLTQLGQLIDHGTKDIKYNLQNGITPDLINRANQAKSLLDEIFVKARGAGATNEEGKPIGYIDQYFTHMAKNPEGIGNQISEIYKHYIGRDSPLSELFLGKREIPTEKGVGVTGDIYNKGMGNPWSPYTQTRSGMNPSEIEYNFNKVIPAYLESMKKVLFDAPAIDKATSHLNEIPNSNLKDTATWAIKNFSGYDADKNLHQAFDSAASQLARVTARSYVNFNLPLHALHLGEIPVNIYPELGEKYTIMGAADVLRKPLQNYTEMARMGLLQGEMKPWAFKTPMERADSASYFFSAVESFVKGIAYNGAKRKFLAEGMNENDAKYAAVAKAKDLTLTVDKARQMKWLSPESKIMGGEVSSRLGGQFKGIPSKIVEQYIDIAREVGKNPDKMEPYIKVMRALAGSTAAGVATAAGAHMYHVNPSSLVKMTAFGPFANTMYQIFGNDIWNAGKRFNQGDDNGAKQYLMQAAIDTAAFITPGGNSIKKGVGAVMGDDVIRPGTHSQKPMKLKFSNPVKVNLNQ